MVVREKVCDTDFFPFRPRHRQSQQANHRARQLEAIIGYIGRFILTAPRI